MIKYFNILIKYHSDFRRFFWVHENRLTKTLPQMLSKYVEVLSTNAIGKKRVKSHIQHEVKKKNF